MPAPFRRYDLVGESFIFLSRESVVAFKPDKWNGQLVTNVSLSNGEHVIINQYPLDFLADISRESDEE